MSINQESKRARQKKADRKCYLKKKMARLGITQEEASTDLRGRHGNHASGEDHGKWRGGRMIDKDGYILIRVGKEYVQEHRLVIESLIGRKLKDDELGHHVDEDRSNNIPENLELMTLSWHMKFHNIGRARDEHGRFQGDSIHPAPVRNERGQYTNGGTA